MERVEKQLRSRSFTLSLPTLTPVEAEVLKQVESIAEAGLMATQDGLNATIAAQGVSTATGVINRLVAKGYLEHAAGFPIQRGLWLRIVSTGQQTAEPNDKTIHWRYRKEPVPSPAPQYVRQREPSTARSMEDMAKKLNMAFSEYLMNCAYVGHLQISAEGE